MESSLCSLSGLVLLFAVGLVGPLAGQEADLEKQIQNPVASRISLPFQNNTNFGLGPLGRSLHGRAKEGALPPFE